MNALPEAARRDLVVLVADKNIEAVIVGLLGRPQSLGIRAISFDVFVHPRRDPGCLTGADDFLRSFYGDLARSVSLKGHSEPTFLRLARTLHEWFSE